MPKLSVVALCFQEGPTAVRFARRLEETLSSARLDYEIIIVSNYISESDLTPGLVRKLAKERERIRTITHRKEEGQGFGWDIREGLAKAKGDVIAFVDGDNQIPPEDVLLLYNKLQEDKLDLAKARRVERHDGTQRFLVTKVYNLIFHIFFPTVHDWDINGKPKILTRAAYEKLSLTSNDWFIDAEIMIQAHQLKLKYGSVPTVFRKKPHRASSYITIFHSFSIIKNLLISRIKTFL